MSFRGCRICSETAGGPQAPRRYPWPLMYIVVLGLVVVNTLNATADLAAIAAGVNLLMPLSN